MKTYTLPDMKVSFEHQIRKQWVTVKGSVWGDKNGIYKIEINDVLIEDMPVIGLLTDADFDDIETAIENEALAIASDNHAVGDIPGPYPTL